VAKAQGVMPKHLNTTDDFEMVMIGRLIPHPQNVNNGDFGAIEESIKANGFFGALVVQKSTQHVLAGNHRLAVAKTLGYSELPVTWVDVDNDAALRILLADNRTARLGNDNPNALAELLAELAGTENGLAGTGFDGDALDQLIADLAGSTVFTPNTDPAQGGSTVTGAQVDKAADTLASHYTDQVTNYKEVICPNCAHEFHVK